jgi:hypothetical protein
MFYFDRLSGWSVPPPGFPLAREANELKEAVGKQFQGYLRAWAASFATLLLAWRERRIYARPCPRRVNWRRLSPLPGCEGQASPGGGEKL